MRIGFINITILEIKCIINIWIAYDYNHVFAFANLLFGSLDLPILT